MSSNESYGPSVPEGYHPPFAVVTPDDHEAWVLIATALGLAFSFVFCLIRIFVRYHLSRGFMGDDFSLFAATGFATIQSSMMFAACRVGLGKRTALLNSESQDEVQVLYYVSNLFFVLTLGSTKLSVVFFLLRMSRNKNHTLVFKIFLGMITAWTVASFLLLALQCEPAHPWLLIGKDCADMGHRWRGICATDMISEIGIVGLVVYMTYSLKTGLSSKLMVVSIFSLRLLIIIAISFRMATFNEAGYTTNPFILEAPFIVWTQVQLSYCVISATIPTFQNFLKALHTGFGGLAFSNHGFTSRYASDVSGTKGGTHELSDLSTSRGMQDEELAVEKKRSSMAQKSKPTPMPNEEVDIDGMAETASYEIDQITMVEDFGRTSSAGSERLIIRKDIKWTVQTEEK